MTFSKGLIIVDIYSDFPSRIFLLQLQGILSCSQTIQMKCFKNCMGISHGMRRRAMIAHGVMDTSWRHACGTSSPWIYAAVMIKRQQNCGNNWTFLLECWGRIAFQQPKHSWQNSHRKKLMLYLFVQQSNCLKRTITWVHGFKILPQFSPAACSWEASLILLRDCEKAAWKD